MLRFTIFAPLSTAQTMPAASSTSSKALVLRLACTIISFASPPKPLSPAPVVTEPAASDATNVPCPVVSTTVPSPVIALWVIGALAAIVGDATSAPVSTTAIVMLAASR
jgi:hypothetical protein